MMIVQYRAKDINLSEANKAHIEAAVEKFKKYSLDITRVMCNTIAEKEGVTVEFEIHVAHAAPIIITEHDKDLDAAIDIAVDRASKALRRLHDKVKDHKAPSIKELLIEDA
jgi:putative sigma-54 modulation protein